MKDISNASMKCCGCMKLIEKENPVFQHGTNMLYHPECYRCKSCDCFLIGKKSFDFQCIQCNEEDRDMIPRQYDNSLRWRQADTSFENKMMPDDLKMSNTYSQLWAKISFYDFEQINLTKNEKNELEKQVKEQSLFFNSPSATVSKDKLLRRINNNKLSFFCLFSRINIS